VSAPRTSRPAPRGRVGGSCFGTLPGPDRRLGWSHRIGVAQLPYAGMAVGLASYTVGRTAAAGAPQVGQEVAALVLGVAFVFVFEVVTPLFVDRALVAVGDAADAPPRAPVPEPERS
jgi:hypothetical protein